MMLTAYADESYTSESGNFKHITVAGYIAPVSYWKTFCVEWSAALKRYGVGYFHFREFANKDFRSQPESPYFGWEEEKLGNFLYELAKIAGSVAIPFGGTVPAAQFIQDGVKDDPILVAYTAFFNDLRECIRSHWPKLTGDNFKERIHFILDINKDKRWLIPFQTAYNVYRQQEPIFGPLTWGDDKEFIPLQAADLLAYATRQQGDWKAKQPRVLDILLAKNIHPETDEYTFQKTIRRIMGCDWNTAVKRLLAIEKEFKRLNPGKKYLPFEHPPFTKRQ